MGKYKVGDRVTITKKCIVDGKLFTKGLAGKIIDESRSYAKEVCVEFDENINGHSCHGKGLFGHCWWFDSDNLQPAFAETKKIVITSDGKETLARLYDGNKVINKAVAKCSPEDEFNFCKGARLAFDRLMGDEPVKSKYYNGKVVCVEKKTKGCPYTVGKIYKFKDGKTVNDDGYAVPLLPVKSLDECVMAKFIPLVD